MTIAAVKVSKENIEIGCDSIALSGRVKDKHAEKMRLTNGLIFVGSGYYQEIVMFDAFLKENAMPEEATEINLLNLIFNYGKWKNEKGFDDEESDVSWLFIYKGKAFFSTGYEVVEIKDGFYTIGAGREIAIGALANGASVQKAIEITCDYCVDCAHPAKVLNIPKNNRMEI